MANLTRTKAASDFFVSGGTLSSDSASYIERSSDALLLEALKQGKYCYILNSRQMGKSSLSVRTIAKLEALGVRTAFVDLTQIGGRNVTPEQWYIGLCGELGRSLGVRAELLAYCKQHADLSPMQRFFGGLRDVVLQRVESQLVIFIDEIDATKNLAFNTDEFFAGIRECFNRRVRDTDLQRLTFCLLGVAVPSDLISNPATTPFNIGERIGLQDFTLQELRGFAPVLGPNGSALIQRIHHWTNGQPFLTQSLCQTVALQELQSPADVDSVVMEQFFGPKARDTNINLADVANRALNGGANETDPERFRADLLSMYERAWKGGNVKDDEANRVAVVLKLSGLLRTNGSRLRVRNRIYHRVFDHQWIRDSMPEQELRRQEHSYRRGLVRGVVLATAIVATVSILGLVAWRSRQEAVASQKRLDYELYVADMSGMRFFEETGDIARMEQVLRRTRGSAHRGFEWALWNRRLHDSTEEYTLDYSAPGKREDGFLSRDGSQICITDALLETATLVDRHTKQAIATRRVDPQAWVVSTSAGIRIVDMEDNAVRVHDLTSGKALFRMGRGPHIPSFTCRRYTDFAFVPAEDRSGGKTIEWQIWSLVTGQMVWKGPPPPGAHEMRLSANGRQVFYLQSLPDGATSGVVYDIDKNAVLDRFPTGAKANIYQFSASGNRVLYQDTDRSLVSRDVPAQRTQFRWNLKDTSVPLAAEFTYDDRYVACLYGTGRATIYDAVTGSGVSMRNNAWTINTVDERQSIVVSSSSVRVVPYLESAGARIIGPGWRIARDGQGCLRVLREDTKQIVVLSDPDARPVATRPMSSATFSWTYNGKWHMRRIAGPPASTRIESVDRNTAPIQVPKDATNFAAGPSGEIFAVLFSDNRLIQGISSNGDQKWQSQAPTQVRGMWITPDSRMLLVLSGEKVLRAYDALTGKAVGTLDAHNVRLTNVVFPNANVFFTCGADGRAILWDTHKLSIIQQFKGNAAQRVSGADVSPDGKRVATCSYAGTWQLWDAATGSQLMDLQASNLPLRGIVFTSDGRSIVTAGEDNRVRVWTTLSADLSVKVPVPPEFSLGIKQ